MNNYKIILQYEGTRYKGWQRLKTTDNTIQQKLEMVLSKLMNEAIEIHGSGRTDAGVHAKGQVANFKSHMCIGDQDKIELFIREINYFLPEDIVVVSLEEVDDRFHARFMVKQKTYVYQLWLAEHPPVFERNYVYDLGSKREHLSLKLMEDAAKLFVGTHDFKGYSTDKTKKSTIRTVDEIKFIKEQNMLKIEFKGNGFLYNMVRIMVGTIIEVGLRERELSTLEKVFDTGIREYAGETAPAKGLYLESVIY
ncbi:tRNA pseudouridine(38-40) synthase TruA [Fusibacter bizertensis]|uniref:tRNA pseudouridine synthase A n=1 Tax=Fusibacter bizertensis TaxID=1488331 RepID=A0ABT6NC11_9FIRM|nr:tRNA pseudouridine(38-40) synthase TruA [Fusibacter bizertensis]MDH8677956.1 tRNA pseudouridine(38-40) synthase TruA [Fusibacter bizertensis]